MDRVTLGVGIGILGMPPPLVGEVARAVAALAASPSRLVHKGMLDPRPVLAAILISVLPLAPACGDDSGSTSDDATTCQEPAFVEGVDMNFAPCGCGDKSPWHSACIAAGNECLYDQGSICVPSCSTDNPCPAGCSANNTCPADCGEMAKCPTFIYEPSFCEVASETCRIQCDGGALDQNCPFGMECAENSGLEWCTYMDPLWGF